MHSEKKSRHTLPQASCLTPMVVILHWRNTAMQHVLHFALCFQRRCLAHHLLVQTREPKELPQCEKYVIFTFFAKYFGEATEECWRHCSHNFPNKYCLIVKSCVLQYAALIYFQGHSAPLHTVLAGLFKIVKGEKV